MLAHLHTDPILSARVVILGAGGFVSSAVQRRLETSEYTVIGSAHAKLDLAGASAVSDGYSKTWHMIFMIAGNGHVS